MKIIVDYAGNMRASGMEEINEFSAIEVFIDKTLKFDDAYVVISGETQDIVKLRMVRDTGSFVVYAPDGNVFTTQRLGVKKLYFLFTEPLIYSNKIECMFSFDEYLLGTQLSVLSSISKDIEDKYKKIVDLTNMNIEMYEKAGGKL